MARVILGLLLFLSVFSWALILQKSYQLGGIDRRTARFLQMFRSGRGLSDPNTLRAGVGGTPLISVYAAGYRELEQQIGGPQSRVPAGANKIRNANAVGVEMQVAAGEEVRRLEKGMSTLATIASVSPFIGLFGTVWGVMDAFSGLGDVGAASLRAVAPGISEALITTAAGLFAAIPALIAYNHYLHGIRAVASPNVRFRRGIRIESRDAVQFVDAHAANPARNRHLAYPTSTWCRLSTWCWCC